MSNVYPVQYAKSLDGRLIAVEQGPHNGWAFGNDVFATKAEALAADGLSAQRAYLAEKTNEIGYAISDMISISQPFSEWREKYEEHDRRWDLAEDIKKELFPQYGKRSEAAQRFAESFVMANEVYQEMQEAIGRSHS